MKELKRELEILLRDAKGDAHVIENINSEKSLFPFRRESHLLMYLLSIHAITYDRYLEISQEYTKRNTYLNLFEMAPRTFGQTWGENHIHKLFPQLLKATKENMASVYPDFDGEFDLWFDGSRIEVKACRANRVSTEGSLASRAYLHKEAAAAGFKYHFQQLKPSCCDIFIWIGVCRDELIYWVLTSEELWATGKLGSQHRNENTGMKEAKVFEGQVFMTEAELRPFSVDEKDILSKITEKRRKSYE